MKIKYYAVKKGVQPGIYTSWEECEKQVKGYSEAEYQRFYSLADAEEFLGTSTLLYGLHIFVDGCYSDKKKVASYGYVAVKDNNIIHEASGIMDKYTDTRDVSGELKATVEAINWAIKQGYSKVYIHYDLEGVAAWATGKWNAKTNISRLYVDYIARIKDRIKLLFIKLTSHSSYKHIDVADELYIITYRRMLLLSNIIKMVMKVKLIQLLEDVRTKGEYHDNR